MRKVVIVILMLIFVACSNNENELIIKDLEGKLEECEDKNAALNENLLSNEKTEKYLDHYKNIIFLSEGEMLDKINEENNETGSFAYRVSITRAEIYKDLYIEEISYGVEGGNKVIESVNHINLAEKLNLFGEDSGSLEFIKWESCSKFQFKVKAEKYSCEIKNINDCVIKKLK